MSFGGIPRYSASKLANLLFMFERNRRLCAGGASTVAVGCHPSLVGTGLGSETVLHNIVMPLANLVLNTPAMGAWGALQAATGPVKPGGYYGPTALRGLRGPSRECKPSEQAHNRQLARRLWDVSITMTGIDAGLVPAEETEGGDVPFSGARRG